MKIHYHKSLLFILVFLVTNQTQGWIYPEHRDIALLAIQKLSPENRSTLERLWSEAIVGHEDRLTNTVIDVAQTIKPAKLDYASWPAISGDHSSSPENLLYNVLKTKWILKVADIAAELKINLAKSKRRSQRINAIRDSDIKLQRADLEYVSRAGTNNVHFLLARPEVDTDAKKYLTSCLTEGADLNALGAYSYFHASALYKAARYSNGNLTAEEKSSLILSALADESFALHFLEDVYAAGHIAGTWGNSSVRKGTHDYYNENGLDVITWEGKRMIVMGDAYMRQEDAEFIADNVRESLDQFISAVDGQVPLDYASDMTSSLNLPDTFDVGKNNFMPPRNFDPHLLSTVLKKSPVPGMATGKGELPRFRAEFGTFIGFSGALNGYGLDGGFGKNQTAPGGVSGIEANAIFGLGIDGVLNEAGDGLVFLQFGLKSDGASSNRFADEGIEIPSGAITAAIPGRTAYNIRFRMPFYLIPGDLLIAGPILLLISPKTLTKMAITAGNGGLIPWQSGIATPVGRFQFILGREIGVSLFGRRELKDVILIPTSDKSAIFLEYRSTQLDFPILEYRPFRTFSTNQSSNITIQLTTGVDIPHATTVLAPVNAAVPELKSVWHIGCRIVFNWRNYFN